MRNALLIQVVFGSPARQCAGNGIRAMLPLNEVVEDDECRAVPVWLSGNPGQMALVMRVNKEAISPAMRRKYFSGDGFEIEEDFIIPQPIKEALGVDRERIGRGKCGMEESADFYDIFL